MYKRQEKQRALPSQALLQRTRRSRDRIEQRAYTNVGEALNELPLFRPLVSPATQQAVGGNIGARVLDLRGLGGVRTLVLLDGKRFIPSTTIGTVDVNLIPSAIVKRTEVVTGGASAAYGSDAVAGVVNFILDRQMEGLKASVQYGGSARGDAQEKNVSLAFGTAFAGGAGHSVTAFEVNDADGMGDCYTRDWCPTEQLVPNYSPAVNGLASNLRVGPDSPGNLNQDGLISTGALRGTTFNSDGTLRMNRYGTTFGTKADPVFTLGGDGTYENGYLQGILLMPPVRRVNVYQHFNYAFSDSLRANLDLSYGQVKGTIIGSEARSTGFSIKRDNAFLPAGLATAMDANGLAAVTLGRVFGDLGGAVDNSFNRTYRMVASLEGDIGANWSWDAYFQHAENKFKQNYTGNVVIARMNNAIDAVVNGNGNVVCRINADASAANDDPACVAFNLFGRGNSSLGAQAYVAPSGYQTIKTTEDVFAANLRGDLVSLPAGALAVAAGVEHRSDKLVGDADALSAANSFWSFNGKAISGKVDVTEGYLEAVAPLLKDVSFAKKLELNGAMRRTSYDRSSPGKASSSTDVTTWKGGLVYEPADQLRLRVTQSRDIRAPNLTEMFGPVQSGRVLVTNPFTTPATNGLQVTSLTGGNPALQPEKADTFTAGVVLTPMWEAAPALRLSVDYFRVQIDGAIGSLGAQTVINRCFAGATEFCPFITKDASNSISVVQDVQQNVNRLISRGVDLELSYATGPLKYGRLDYRLLATRYLELSTKDSAGVTDRAGQTGYRPGGSSGVPRSIVDGNVTWSLDRTTAALHLKYIPKGILDVLYKGPEDKGYVNTLPNSVSSNRVDSRMYVDASASYRLRDGVEVFGAINNLFDKDPPLAASAQGGTNQVYFDPIGRYFKVGVRVKM